MSKNIELLKNTSIIFLGKVSTQLLSFLLLPLYTSYLTTYDYGTVDLIITYISLLVPVITIQLEMAAFRYLVDARGKNDEIKKIISNIIYCILCLTLLFIALYYIFSKFMVIKYGELVLVNIMICIFSNLFLQLARGLGENIIYSVASCISGITTIIFNILLIVVYRYGAVGMLLSMIIANLSIVIFLFAKLKIYKFLSFKELDKKLIRELVKYSTPLVPNGVSWWIVNVSDRTIISYFIGVSANGIYATSNKFSSLFIGMFNIFNMSWTESASVHINSEDRDKFFSETINSTFKIFSCLCLIVIACMPFIFSIFINRQYSESYYYIPILLLSTLFNIIVGLYSAIYIAKKMTKEVALTSILAAVINITINLIFIKLLGLYAASISTAISYLIMGIYRHYDIKKYVNIKWDKKYLFSYIIIYLFSILMYYNNTFLGNIINILVVSIYAFEKNKFLLINGLNLVSKKLKRDKLSESIK